MSVPALASVSLDLDNKWSYLKTHGDPRWRDLPSYLDVVVPRVLSFLREEGMTITFFIVGQDAAVEAHRPLLAALAADGHEIGNHSFHHEPWLHRYDRARLEEEFDLAERHIEAATGRRPVGFRGPGYSLSPDTLAVLAARGYAYDCTVFPNLLNPLARAYFFARSGLSREERRRRRALFGSWRDALRPVKPFFWDFTPRPLLEIPVTTLPLFKVPMHMSYLIYLARFSRGAALAYWQGALALCRLTGTEPSMLLHPLDFLGPEDEPDLGFFPGMDVPAETKLALMRRVFDALRRRHRLVTLREHAAAVRDRDLAVHRPAFERE
ncbi:MAG: polysaccharide deacetylase [Gammaproteobacteria bacterium]|nr:MAG: polysaccharide deacetylase [Gammaproteobacteria bacterium]